VNEWQRRGVPHFHMALWFDAPPHPADLLSMWCDLAEPYGAVLRGQHSAPISDAVGWFQYVSKHAARGISHYQRSPENVPSQWHGKTGRMWGYLGNWPRRDAIHFDLSDAAFYAFRRWVRSYRRADARKSRNGRRIAQARRMLSCPDPKLSAVRGVSEWIELDDQVRMLVGLAALGYEVEQRQE